MAHWEPHQIVEIAPGRWRELGTLSPDEIEQMKALGRRDVALRHELAGMLIRWGEALEADHELALAGLPGEVSEAGGLHDLSYLRAQRAVDAMRAHMAALGIRVERQEEAP